MLYACIWYSNCIKKIQGFDGNFEENDGYFLYIKKINIKYIYANKYANYSIYSNVIQFIIIIN